MDTQYKWVRETDTVIKPEKKNTNYFIVIVHTERIPIKSELNN